jgi:hypothetical protein
MSGVNTKIDITPNYDDNNLNKITDAYDASRIADSKNYSNNPTTYSPLNNDGIDYLNIPGVDYLYLTTIRGGSRMVGNCGCNNMKGGCLSCTKGAKNIMHIYKVVHIIIPTLYIKYKQGKEKAGDDAKKVKKVNKVNRVNRVKAKRKM